MKDSVIVNGITLTREQLEGALVEINKPEPISLNTKGISFIVPLSNGKSVMLRDELGSHQGRGLYLDSVKGSRWVIHEKGTPHNPWQLFTLEPQA